MHFLIGMIFHTHLVSDCGMAEVHPLSQTTMPFTKPCPQAHIEPRPEREPASSEAFSINCTQAKSVPEVDDARNKGGCVH